MAGIRCGQLGVEAVVIDDQPLGGTCLNVGCIPSKALIHAADELAALTAAADPVTHGIGALGIRAAEVSIDLATTRAWKDGIVRRLNDGVGTVLAAAGTEVIAGRARFLDGKTVEVIPAGADAGHRLVIEAEHVVIATGSAPIALDAVPFGTGPVGPEVLSSTGALDLTEVPRSLAVVGGGYIGLELGTAFAKLGAHVTIVELAERVLPQYDRELTRPVERRLADLDVTVLAGTRATGLTAEGLAIEGPDGPAVVGADKVLVTVGRRPMTDGLGLDELVVTMDGQGGMAAITVDDRCQTSMRNVWAIGDVTGEPMLAHRAMRQGEVVAEAIAGRPIAFDNHAIPAIVFTDPEVVTVGFDPDRAREVVGGSGAEIVVGRFPLTANGRAMTLADEVGFVRVVARADNHLVVGIQAVGSAVAELASGFGLAIEMGARLEDIAGTIHAHPTLGEAFGEAALVALGHPIHIARRGR